MFRSALRCLRFKPQDGLRVVARGRVSVYDPKGEYQIVCEHLEPEGLGARQLAFEQLKERLPPEGLFDAAPQAAAAGAAAQDRRRHVARRRRGARHHQGAAPPLRQRAHRHPADARAGRGRGARHRARACAAIGKVPGVDVVIVGRGGGSIEDLWAFNEEVVARAIAGCPVPTISAVGHETDVTIADFVADLRAPTPSAAAEMVVVAQGRLLRAHRSAVAARRRRRCRRALHRLESRLRDARGAAGLRRRARPARDARPARRRAERTSCAARCARSWRAASARISALRLTLETFDLRRRLGARPDAAGGGRRPAAAPRSTRAQHAHDARLRSAAARLESLSPLAVLGRGYAVCWNDDRTRDHPRRGDGRAGDRVRVTLSAASWTVMCDGSTPQATTGPST